MRRPKNDLTFVLALGMAFSVALVGPSVSSVWAQSTVDSFSKPANSKRQKSPESQLAKRFAQADQKSGKNTQPAVKPKTDDKAAKPAPQPVSKERRAELMAFVKTHHPELQPLLNQLQAKRKNQFESVLRTLDKNVYKLQALEKKSPARHKRALDHWVISSKIQLLSAQLAIKKSDKDKASVLGKIRGLLEKEHELHRENTLVAIEAAERKVERLKETLKTHVDGRESEIASKLAEIDKTSQLVSAKQKKKPVKKKAKPQGPVPKNELRKEAKETKPSQKAKPSQKVKPTQEAKPTEKSKPVEKSKSPEQPKEEKSKVPE